jgi:hypothetical protein
MELNVGETPTNHPNVLRVTLMTFQFNYFSSSQKLVVATLKGLLKGVLLEQHL